jgi:hypothetical protein
MERLDFVSVIKYSPSFEGFKTGVRKLVPLNSSGKHALPPNLHVHSLTSVPL